LCVARAMKTQLNETGQFSNIFKDLGIAINNLIFSVFLNEG